MKYLISYKLFENKKSELTDKLYKITDKLYKNNILLKAYINDELEIVLMDIKSPSKGLGTKSMMEITKFADIHHLPIKLIATSAYGADIDRLINFYKRFGFNVIKDFPGFKDGKEMYRKSN